MTTLLGKLSNNFLTAAFVPALWFVILVELLFSPLDIAGSAKWGALPVTLEGSLITLVFTLMIGFTLMGLNTFLYKLLEGYYLLERFPGRHYKHAIKLRKRQREFEVRDQCADRLFDLNKNEQDLVAKARREEQINRLRRSSRDLKASFKQDYPSRTDAVLPTRFGNILKSSEQYAGENYRIDSVVMWPRLIHVIAPEYYRKLDESNNGLAFIVNCMVLALLLALLSLGAAGYRGYQTNWGSLPPAQTQQQVPRSISEESAVTAAPSAAPASQAQGVGGSPFLYVGGAVIFMGIAWFFYNASLPAARQYGNLFRSAFDLFRFDLLTQLRLPLPTDEVADTLLWEQLSGFLALGELDATRANPFSYVHPPSRLAQEPVRQQD